jgi:two-component system cell cycle response regulator DivK
MAKKVLIFDDEADILEICKLVLESKGIEVATRLTCTNVIADVKAFSPDLVIMDNWIPDIGGVASIRLIKKEPGIAETPVILFTANKDIEKLVAQAGADGFIEKPFDIATLEKEVLKKLL